MLEYREFPTRTALTFILFSLPTAYCIYIITQVTRGVLLLPYIVDHMPLLGYGALAATLLLIPVGFLIDRVKRSLAFAFVGGLLPVIVGILRYSLGSPNEFSPYLEYMSVIGAFIGLALILPVTAVVLNRTIVVRFRGKVVALFLSISILTSWFLILFESTIGGLAIMGFPLLEVSLMVAVIIIGALRPWNLTQVSLAGKGHSGSYFLPMVCIMAAHMLWTFSTESTIRVVDGEFVSLVASSMWAGYFQPLALAIGVILAGFLADFKGRKTAFSAAILMMGLLTIFGSTFYVITGGTVELEADLLLVILRGIEGYLLGLCLMLIWSEFGSPLTKGRRLTSVWFFFLGYMCLYWAVDLQAWGWGIPFLVTQYGSEVAVLLTLLALYWSGHLPEVLGEELEMEDLDIAFDEKEVRRTVDAFLGQEDFDAVRSQVEIIDAGAELSDSEMSDILGEGFAEVLPLQRIPGVGSSLESRLTSAGYTSAAQIAGETPSRLASKVEGLSETRAEKVIDAARQAVKKTIKEKDAS
ncbi:MAG: hypothetical protein JSW61_07770 [Candidatus Thorarchaeota archaeon]|nr:MAG: hypothetical protein JSW61_07770 [Candidatus Thorarchaeota archaeon]